MLTNTARRTTAPGATWRVPPAVSHSSLVETYISALNLTAVTVVGAGRRCRIITGEPEPGEPVAHRFFFRASHAGLVLATIGQDGMSGQPAAVLAGAIEQAAASIGAPFQTPDELRKAAGQQVAEIVERVKTAGLSGKLKRWNKAYKQYRLAQVAEAKQAMPYANYIEQAVTMPTVRQIAASGRMI
jgi:hypothetical protein